MALYPAFNRREAGSIPATSNIYKWTVQGSIPATSKTYERTAQGSIPIHQHARIKRLHVSKASVAQWQSGRLIPGLAPD